MWQIFGVDFDKCSPAGLLLAGLIRPFTIKGLFPCATHDFPKLTHDGSWQKSREPSDFGNFYSFFYHNLLLKNPRVKNHFGDFLGVTKLARYWTLLEAYQSVLAEVNRASSDGGLLGNLRNQLEETLPDYETLSFTYVVTPGGAGVPTKVRLVRKFLLISGKGRLIWPGISKHQQPLTQQMIAKRAHLISFWGRHNINRRSKVQTFFYRVHPFSETQVKVDRWTSSCHRLSRQWAFGFFSISKQPNPFWKIWGTSHIMILAKLRIMLARHIPDFYILKYVTRWNWNCSKFIATKLRNLTPGGWV